MTGVLNVDTIADNAGTGPVTLTKQSANKAWTSIDQAASSTLDSFNQSSFSDSATGRGSVSFTNSFASATFCNVANGNPYNNGGIEAGCFSDGNGLSGDTKTSGRSGFDTRSSSGTLTDNDDLCIICDGDLA